MVQLSSWCFWHYCSSIVHYRTNMIIMVHLAMMVSKTHIQWVYQSFIVERVACEE